MCQIGNILWGSNGGSNASAVMFSLSQLPNYTEFTNLFDQYRIDRIKVVFEPVYRANQIGINYPNAASGTTSGDYFGGYMPQPPRFATVIDYDDGTAPASMDELRQYGNVRETLATTRQVRSFKPACLGMVYESISSTAYTPKFGTWLSVTDPTTPHYAIRWWLDSITEFTSGLDTESGFDGAICYKVFVTFNVSFRNVK